jgi:glycosyltransferase involved in cell wall biosynthesis
VINSLGSGGAEKLLLDTIPIYNANGITVDLLVLNQKNSKFFDILKAKNCCKIYNLNVNSIYDPRIIFKLKPFLKNADIVHAHLFPTFYYVALCKRFFNVKIKLIFTEHSTANKRMNIWIFRAIDLYMYSLYDKIICISNTVKTVIKSNYKLKDSQIQVIHNGINLETIYKANPIDLATIDSLFQLEQKYIIQVSRFLYPKDHKTLINALCHLPSYIKLILVGTGELLEACQSQVSKLKLQDRVIFLGFRTDVPRLLKSSDIIVLSTFYEGLSLSSMEALACGKPFIGSNVPGLKEVIQGAGLMFDVRNSRALAAQVFKLLSDTSYYQQIASQCLSKSQNYSIDKMVLNHIKLYEAQVG